MSTYDELIEGIPTYAEEHRKQKRPRRNENPGFEGPRTPRSRQAVGQRQEFVCHGHVRFVPLLNFLQVGVRQVLSVAISIVAM